ncbi:MAG: extracellular solute-binding protein, partial [Waterburya sp.]
TLGDVWLGTAIQQNLIKPLSVKNLNNWQELPASWQKLVQRDRQGNLTPDGEIYAAPYRWGSTVIAYRSDKLEKLDLIPTDWQDLWQPELRDRISLLNSPREVIGLTLKKLGKSYNTNNLDSVTDLESELLALHKQAKLYSSDRYLEPLILGDTWAAVAWSTDILPVLKRYPEIKFIIPQSGTSLWADLWVKPQSSPASLVANREGNPTVIESWIDYCWQPQAAKQISLFTDGISPILSAIESAEIPPDLKQNVFLNSAILNSDKSEFLLPLTAETEQQYRDLWLKIRS